MLHDGLQTIDIRGSDRDGASERTPGIGGDRMVRQMLGQHVPAAAWRALLHSKQQHSKLFCCALCLVFGVCAAVASGSRRMSR